MHQELLSFDGAAQRRPSPVVARPSIQGRFELFLQTEEGLAIYREFVRIAKELRAAGREHYGAKAILEVIRYHWALQGPASDPFAINNIWGSRMARRAMEHEAELAGFFETRELKSE